MNADVSWLESATKLVAIIGGLIAAGLAIWQLRQGVRQRRIDLRWKQAEMAKRVVDEWFELSLSKFALQMTESGGRSYPVREDRAERILLPEVLSALQVRDVSNDEKALFIQDCFDALFYLWDRTEQFLQSGLILEDDVRRPTEYHVRQMSEHRPVYEGFAAARGYDGALVILGRFSASRDAGQVTHRTHLPEQDR